MKIASLLILSLLIITLISGCTANNPNPDASAKAALDECNAKAAECSQNIAIFRYEMQDNCEKLYKGGASAEQLRELANGYC